MRTRAFPAFRPRAAYSDTHPQPCLPTRRFFAGGPKDKKQNEIFTIIAEMSKTIHTQSSAASAGSGPGTPSIDAKEPSFRVKSANIRIPDPLAPFSMRVSITTNMHRVPIEFMADAERETAGGIARDFAHDFGAEARAAFPHAEPSCQDITNSIKDAIVAACKRPERVTLRSREGQELIRAKMQSLVHILHLAGHDICAVALAEIDLATEAERNEGAEQGAAKDPSKSDKKRDKVRRSRRHGKRVLPRLPPTVSFRYGDIVPDDWYVAEARQDYWQELQAQWWSNAKDSRPRVLIVSGAPGAGKTAYARFVCGTLTHLIPDFKPRYQCRYRFSSAASSLPAYLSALCGGAAVDWRRDVLKKLRQDVSSVVRQSLDPSDISTLRDEAHQSELYKRTFQRRQGVVLLDNVPTALIPELRKSAVWPRSRSDKCVLVITTRMAPPKPARGVVSQELRPWDPVATRGVMMGTMKPNPDLSTAFRGLSSVTGGLPLAAFVLQRFTGWVAGRRSRKKGTELAHEVVRSAAEVTEALLADAKMAGARKSASQQGTSKKAADFHDCPEDVKRASIDGHVFAQGGGAPAVSTEHLSRALSYVYNHMPRAIRGIFRTLLVFAGEFSAESVASVLEIEDVKSVRDCLEILLDVGLLCEAEPYGLAGREGKIVGETAAHIVNAVSGRRFELTDSIWRFCYLLNASKRSHAHGSKQGRLQKEWLGKIAANYVSEIKSNWVHVNIALRDAVRAEADAPLAIFPGLKARDDILYLQQLSVHIARRDAASVLAAAALALSLSNGPVKATGAFGAMLGLNASKRRPRLPLADERVAAVDDRVVLTVPGQISAIIFSGKVQRALCSAYLRLHSYDKGAGAKLARDAKADADAKDVETDAIARLEPGERCAWGWLAMASAYSESNLPNLALEAYSSALRELRAVAKAPTGTLPPDGGVSLSKWLLRCVMGLCSASERLRRVEQAVKLVEEGDKLVRPLANERPLASHKFTLRGRTRGAVASHADGAGDARVLWSSLARVLARSIRLYTKIGAFQNAIDLQQRCAHIAVRLGGDAGVVVECESLLAVGDSYLRLGMWDEAMQSFEAVYKKSIQMYNTLPGADRLRARALCGRSNTAQKNGSFFVHARNQEELKRLCFASDLPLLVDRQDAVQEAARRKTVG